MKTTHHEIEIAYDESNDRWHFDLRGRKRSAETLSKAKEAIDKEPAEKRKQVFPRFEAYLFKSFNNGVATVTVTGIADEAWRGQPQFWISDKAGKRSKKYASSLFPVNEKNTAILAEIIKLETQIEALQEAKSKQHEKMQCVVVPKELA